MLNIKIVKEQINYPDKIKFRVWVKMEVSSSAFDTYIHEELIYSGPEENIADQIEKDLSHIKYN